MQVEGATAPGTALSGGFLDLIKDSSPISQFVLVVLVIFSIVSWGIILYKLWTFNRIQSQSSRFLEIFRRSTKFSEVQAVCQSLNDSPLVGIFLAGYAELNLQLRQSGGGANTATPAAAPRPVLKSLVSVDRALMRASNVETNKLEKHITFLATTAAVTPFIGLFGTVLGIISAFQGIGAQGSTSLDVVAPGIADALIATAAGLAAAIPAVYFYNLLTQRVKGARVGDGRLLARVPEHRRAQFHLNAESSILRPRERRAFAARPQNLDVARGNQRRAAGRRHARAADHLHGDGTDDAAWAGDSTACRTKRSADHRGTGVRHAAAVVS